MPNRHPISFRLVSMSDFSSAAEAAATVSVLGDTAGAIASTVQISGVPGLGGSDSVPAVAQPEAIRICSRRRFRSDKSDGLSDGSCPFLPICHIFLGITASESLDAAAARANHMYAFM
jgi:hypothetical protein